VKTLALLMGLIGVAAFIQPQPASAGTAACSSYIGQTKIWWDGIELRPGQIGRLTIVEDTPLFYLSGETRTFSRTLKKGEFYRIYAFKPGMLSVGGGYYVDRDARVTYQTPSKTKLAAVRCIKGFANDPARGFYLNASVNFVKSKETARLINTASDQNLTVLVYEIPNKFNAYTHLTYYFTNGQLKSLHYDFMPDERSYDSYSQMGALFEYYLSGVVTELGDGYYYSTDKYSKYSALWRTAEWDTLFAVNDDKVYTQAYLFVQLK